MGNTSCCSNDGNASKEKGLTAQQSELRSVEASPVLDDGALKAGKRNSAPAPKASDLEIKVDIYTVTLNKEGGGRLGLDVDYMAERAVLPVMAITGGLAEAWNQNHSDKPLRKGDSVIEVNKVKKNVAMMLEKCKSEKILELTLKRECTYDHLVTDLENLIVAKGCGPILIRLSWHDAGVFSEGKLTGGCPNAAMRLPGNPEAKFDANAGLPQVAIPLLAPIASKYCPDLISNADLWALVANVAIRMMGGPDIPTRFGRTDGADAVSSQVGRLPDGDKGAAHLREIFHPKGIDDKGIVALSGSHTVGHCHVDRSGFDGAWSEKPLVFDNSYFKDLVNKKHNPETTAKGNPQHKCPVTGTIMLESDLALMKDAAFKKHVTEYAKDQDLWFKDFTNAWICIQEGGCTSLRDIL